MLQRFKEHTARPKAVEKATHQLSAVTTMMAEWNSTMPHITEEEKQKVTDLVEKIRAWIEDNVEAQAKLTAFETPAFSASDVTAQMKPLTLQFDKLLKKPKPEVKKVSSRALV
jgi:hypoxia up-regulated 1